MSVVTSLTPPRAEVRSNADRSARCVPGACCAPRQGLADRLKWPPSRAGRPLRTSLAEGDGTLLFHHDESGGGRGRGHRHERAMLLHHGHLHLARPQAPRGAGRAVCASDTAPVLRKRPVRAVANAAAQAADGEHHRRQPTHRHGGGARSHGGHRRVCPSMLPRPPLSLLSRCLRRAPPSSSPAATRASATR